MLNVHVELHVVDVLLFDARVVVVVFLGDDVEDVVTIFNVVLWLDVVDFDEQILL